MKSSIHIADGRRAVRLFLGGTVCAWVGLVAGFSVRAEDAPAFARYSDGAFSYYSASMEAVSAPAGGMNDTISILFGSDADYQKLKTIPTEVAKAKGLALEANLTLSTATDWSTYGFDLNGKTLSLAGVQLKVSSMPGTGTITATSANSVLNVNVPSGLVTTNSAVTLTGGNKLQVWKTGAGTLRMDMANTGFSASGSTSMVVKEGFVNKGSGATCGAAYSRIVIENGAQLDINGRNYHDYDFTISGTGPDGLGALVCRTSDGNPGWTNGTGYMRNISLGADAKIGGTTPMSLTWWNSNANATTLNGHTLSLGNTTIYSGTMRFEGTGTLYVEPGATYKFNDFWGNPKPCINQGTLRVGGNLEIQGNMIVSSSNLVFTSTGKFVASKVIATTVYDWYAPNLAWTGSQKHPTVTLGTASSLNTHLDLSLFTSTFDGSTTTFYSGSSVTVVLGSRTFTIGEKLVSWGTLPTATFTPAGDNVAGIALDAKLDGLYVKAPKLKWKGGDGNWSDTNWLDENGNTVGWTNDCDADFTSTPGVTVNVASDVRPISVLLSDDCVFTGAGCILQSSIAVASGITATFAHIGGGSSFDKAGAGTLVLTASAPATTVNVNAGRLNVSGTCDWSAATVNVANGATFGGTGSAKVALKNYNPANGSTLGEGLTLSSTDSYAETRFQNQTLYVNGTWEAKANANSGNRYFSQKNCIFRGTGTGAIVSESFGMSSGTSGEFNDMTLIATGNTSGGNRCVIGRMWGNLRLNNVTLRMRGGDFENYNSSGVLYVGDNKTITFDTADAATGEGRTYTAHAGRTPIGTMSGYTTGKFRKTGAGTMRLYYNMPLTGDSTVEGGTLEMNANFAAPLTVAKVGDADPVLKVVGSRTFAGITLGAASRLNCQDGAVGTLTMSGALTIASDTTIDLELTGAGCDALAFSGDDGFVMTSGRTVTFNVSVADNWVPGEYRLIDKGVMSLEGLKLKLTGARVDVGRLVARDGALYLSLENGAASLVIIY